MKSTPGKRLSELIESRGLTAADLASAVNIPKSSMSMYLSDKRKMKADRIKIISDKYNVSETWLMGYDVPMLKTAHLKPDYIVSLDGFDGEPNIIELTEDEHKLAHTKRILSYASLIAKSELLCELFEVAKTARNIDIKIATELLKNLKEYYPDKQ